MGSILLSAFVIGGLYAWRWLTGTGEQGAPVPTTAAGKAKSLIGLGPQVSPEGFIIAWGVVYMFLSILSTVSPGLAGAFALLILLGGVVANFASASESALALEQAKSAAPSNPKLDAALARERQLAATQGPATRVVRNKAGGLVEVPTYKPLY